jgi:hypothetical protein
MKKETKLVIKTVDGKRLVFTESGERVELVSMTREMQDNQMAQRGICEVLIRVICKCE